MKKLLLLLVIIALFLAAFMIPAVMATARESPDVMLAPAATIMIPTTPATTFTAISDRMIAALDSYGRSIYLSVTLAKADAIAMVSTANGFSNTHMLAQNSIISDVDANIGVVLRL